MEVGTDCKTMVHWVAPLNTRWSRPSWYQNLNQLTAPLKGMVYLISKVHLKDVFLSMKYNAVLPQYPHKCGLTRKYGYLGQYTHIIRPQQNPEAHCCVLPWSQISGSGLPLGAKIYLELTKKTPFLRCFDLKTLQIRGITFKIPEAHEYAWR